MTDKLPAPCEHCGGTGIFHGSECVECQGKGYRLVIDGHVTAVRAATPPHGPYRNRNARGRSRPKV
jgi:DnaJ-class molecular chaperone